MGLPAEAQWEYACRAGTTTAYHSGDTEADLAEFSWYGRTHSAGRTHPVGTKKPNGFGLHNMHGNVREWCEDEFSPGSGLRASRGGGWSFHAGYCRSAHHDSHHPSSRVYNLGFRPIKPSP